MLRGCPSLGLWPRSRMSAKALVCDSADFDSTNDWLSRSGTITGLASSKLGSLSFWFRLDGNGFQFLFGANITTALQWYVRLDSGKIEIDSVSSRIRMRSLSTFSSGAAWHHVLASWDVGNAIANLWIDGVNELDLLNITDAAIPWNSCNSFTLGSDLSGSDKFNGCLAEWWLAPGVLLPFNKEPVRRRFRLPTNKPANLGATGAVPAGVAPGIYLHLDDAETANNFATNRTGNGNFTVNGALSAGSTSPSD